MGKKIHGTVFPAFPESFGEFFQNWLFLLQRFVLPRYTTSTDSRRVNESATIRLFAQGNQIIWGLLEKEPIRTLVQQRYIRTSMLANAPARDYKYVDPKVKSATDYLRLVLEINTATITGLEEPNSGESGLSVDMTQNSFFVGQAPFLAVMILLYQIRCNLFHGVKGYRIQSERNELLTTIGSQILANIIEVLNQKSEAPPNK